MKKHFIFSILTLITISLTAQNKFLEAVQANDLKKVEKMIDKGQADYSAEDPYGNKALHIAVERRMTNMLRLLCKSEGINLNAVNETEWTPLIMAGQAGNTGALRILCQYNADPDIKDFKGNSALHYAVMNGRTEASRLLVEECNANIDIQNKEGSTPLMEAIKIGAYEIQIDNLLHNKANTEVKEFTKGNTALMVAIEKSHFSAIKKLLNAGADIHARNNKGYTPLIVAVNMGSLLMVKQMVENGALVSTTDNQGRNAIDHASNYPQIQQYLEGVK